jgi:hypothetical protein
VAPSTPTHGLGRAQQGDEDIARIEIAESGGLNHAGEHLLRLRARRATPCD